MIETTAPTAAAEFRRSWRVVIAAMFGLGFGAGASLYWFGVLIGPLSRQFGWSNTAISGWALVLTVARNLVAPYAGLLADRFGARIVALWSIPFIAFGFAAVGMAMNSLWVLYAGALVIGIADSAWATYTRAINSWFEAGRGLALGFAFCGAALTSIAGPRILQIIVDAWGWRAGFMTIGAFALAPLPPVFFWLRERREEADGERGAAPESGYRMREALGARTFWLFGSAVFLYFLYFIGVQFNLIPLLTERGLSRADAAVDVGVMAAFILFGKLFAGALFDRLHAPFVLAFLLMLDAAALGILGLFHANHAIPALAIIGFAHGAVIAGVPYCVVRYFGLKFFGGISGLVALLLAFAAAGPLLFSVLRDISNSYGLSLFVSGGLDLGAAASFAILGLYPYLSAEAPER